MLDNPHIIHLFVNIHPEELRDDHLLDEFAPLSQVADRVVLEITERASLQDIPNVRDRVARLRELGYRIAVDDLGAGFAGLGNFALLSPDIVKVDMSLVRHVDRDHIKQQLVRGLARTCRELSTMIVAEGIETQQEHDTVVNLGCTLLQGYYHGRPGPLPGSEGALT